jgi:hypothetical protein
MFPLNVGLCVLGTLPFCFYNMGWLGIEDFVSKSGESKRLILAKNGYPSVVFSEVAEVSESLVELSQNLFHLFFLLDHSHLGLPVELSLKLFHLFFLLDHIHLGLPLKFFFVVN